MWPLQRAWLGYIKAKSTCREQTYFGNSSKLIDSKLNPLADIFLPSYIKNKDSVSDITEFIEKCEGFSKKHKQVPCDDLSLNIELIDTNVKGIGTHYLYTQ